MNLLRKLRDGAGHSARECDSNKGNLTRGAVDTGHDARASSGSILGDINAIAETWFKQSWFESSPRIASGLCSPEELVLSASERQIEVSYGQRKVSSLKPHEFPCVIMDRHGASTILTGRPNRREFTCQINGKTERRSVRDVAAQHTGIVFFVAPKSDPAVHDPVSPDNVDVATPIDLYSFVKSELFGSHKWRFLQLCICAALSNLFLLSVPIFSMAIYDRVIPHFAMETLWALSIGVIFTVALDFFLRVIRAKLTDAIGLTTSTIVQARMFGRILKAKFGQVPARDGGLMAGMREVEALSQIVPAYFTSLFVDVPFFLLASILLFSIGDAIVIAPLTCVMLIGAIQVLGDVKADKAAIAARVSATQANLLLETLRNIETVKVTVAALPLMRRWERLVDSGSYAAHNNRLHGVMTGLAAMSISQLAVIGTIISGVYLISAGQMSLGALSASTLLVGRMMSPMSQLGSSIHRLVQIRRSSKSVELILKAEQESVGDPASARSAINGDLRFTSVGFTYPGEQLPALKDINLRIAAGERVGIIGGAGSGKSTLLRLILRLLEPSEGALLIDDRDMRQTAPDNLRRHFGFMSQDAMLFDDTIRNAVCFGIDRVEEADFLAAVKIAGVADFAARHPMGYSMRIGPRAERLSGGERQSVMLARTLVGRPRCLVLDEPTAAIDNTMEMKIVADLKASLGDRGLIVATHRAPMIALVDRLIWLERGRILADGPKEEVLRKLSEKRVA